MKRIKKTLAGGFYIFESRVSANSNYIESIVEAKMLMKYARYFLRDYLIIHDYLITKDGWQMAVKIRPSLKNTQSTEAEIENDNPFETEQEVWRIISERIRLFIATYAKQVNIKRGRTGVLVHSSYQRYYFTTLSEAKEHISKLRNQQIKLYQKRRKYRGIKTHYRISNIIGKGSIFLCSRELKCDGGRVSKIAGRSMVYRFQNLVLADLVRNTQIMHNSPKQHQKPYSKSQNQENST